MRNEIGTLTLAIKGTARWQQNIDYGAYSSVAMVVPSQFLLFRPSRTVVVVVVVECVLKI
jgi:hypothetical protein